MTKNSIRIAFLFCILTSSLLMSNTCETADDYGIINSDTILSGSFLSEGDDYWISFTTECQFRDVTISTCGSYGENTEDGLEYLDTILEVYRDSDDGQEACALFDSWSVELGQSPNTNWWNDDPEDGSNLLCDTNDEEFDGEENHSVLVIPTQEEQNMGVRIDPGTYYIRISGYPGHSVGEWNLHLTGRAIISPIVSDQNLELPHNPEDGAPGGYLEVLLDASESICTEQIVTYEWIANDTTLAGPSEESSQSVFLEYGEHQISLIAIDLVGDDYDEDFTVSITEPNSSPISNAGEDMIVVIPHDGDVGTEVVTVMLSGELSSDDDGDDLSFLWEKIEGPDDMVLSNSESMAPTFNAFNPFGSDNKEYEFELIVSDPYGNSDVDSILVTIISEQNSSPIASSPHLEINVFHDGDPNTFESEEFTLDGSDSSDPDGDNLVSYEWKDGQLEQISQSILYTGLINYSTIDSVLGEHNFKLIVTDPYGAVDDTTIVVNIGPEPNEPPAIVFNPPIAEFTCNPDENPGCLQLVVLDSYNASYDPDNCDPLADPLEEGCVLLPEEERTDEIISEWFDEYGNPVFSVQTLSQGQTNFTLRVTDSYGEYTESVFVVLISEPNSIPTSITLGFQEEYESTVDLDLDGILPDTLSMYGTAVDANHSEDELGIKWSLLTEENSITIIDDQSIEGKFLSEEILHNDFPLNVDFSLTVWDPFSCHILNTQAFEDINQNQVWDEGESWYSFCQEGEDSTTFGIDTLNYRIKNYNHAPQIFPESYQISDLIIDEDVDSVISFDYNLWSENNFFFDPDDCDFDSLTNSCLGYLPEDFSVVLLQGEHYTSSLDTLILDKDYYGSLVVPIQIDDMNELNNLSDTILINVQVEPINDAPVIESFINDEIVNDGVTEDTWFSISLEDLTYTDVEEDINQNGVCDDDECDEIQFFAHENDYYSFSSNGTVILTQNFFGNLELGIMITDGEDASEPFNITIPVEGVNDYPNLIENMDTLYLTEDFPDTTLDLNYLFEDVDGDILNYNMVYSNDNSAIFNFESIGNELLLNSNQDIYGNNTLYFEVSDSILNSQNNFISDSVVFIITPVNDPPNAISGLIATPEDNTVDVPLQATDVDSDSLFFEIVSYPEHGTLGSLVVVDNFSASISYTPEPGYRCEDTFDFVAKDLIFNGSSFDTLSVSDTTAMIIEVGECNYPPDLNVSLSINAFEDNALFFVNTVLETFPENYFSLEDQSNFSIYDLEDSTSFIEFWEGDNYYIEDGFCAYPTLLDHWYVDTEKHCGLIPAFEECPPGLQTVDTDYKDGTKYCACSSDQTCTASEFYLDTLSIRPVQDFDESFQITTIANDGNLLYNLSDTSFVDVYISGINDPPTIGVIEDQVIDEGETLNLTYFYSESMEVDSSQFTIYDVDNEESEIFISLYSDDIYYQTLDADSILITNLFNSNWNGFTEVFVILQDEEFLSDTTSFYLTVNQVDDPPIFETDLGVGDNEPGLPLYLLEDTVPGAFDSEIRIYYNDPDWDPLVNDNPEEYLFEGELSDTLWSISPMLEAESKINFIKVGDPEVGITDDNELYYQQRITLDNIEDDWNGSDGVRFINNSTGDELLLSVHVVQQNDAPNSFDVVSDPISLYNNNQYSWNSDEASICTDEEIVQGVFEDGICTVSNFFTTNFIYSCDVTSDTFQTIEACETACFSEDLVSGECLSENDMFYRLPYRRTPTTEIIEPDSLLLKWVRTSDVDMDPSYSQHSDNNIELYYRIELIDEAIERVYVLKDSIPDQVFDNPIAEQFLVLDQSFFTYDENLNYFDQCGIFSEELTLSDTSRLYLDLSGNTKYSWRVSANNLWCDELGQDPSTATLGEGVKTDFYIDLVPPAGNITVMQNEIAPEFMKLYLTFDELIDTWKSEIFITHDSNTQSYAFPESSSDIYTITELFPGTGIIDIDVESWDGVGNGILSRMSLTYEEILSGEDKMIQSPSGSFILDFGKDDIQSNSSIIIQEKPFLYDELFRSVYQQVSPIYQISSLDMNIINNIDLEILIPEEYYDLEHWKFKIFSVENDMSLRDITLWSKPGVVFGELDEISDVVLYYDPEAEVQIPSDINLVGNYPNPFNPSTKIFYFVESDYELVNISILDLLGREVKVLYDGIDARGYHEIDWDGTNVNGNQLGSGIYFINAKIGDRQIYKKVMKLK